MSKLEKRKLEIDNHVERLCERRNISYSQPEQFSFNIVQGDSVSISAIERELAIAKELDLTSLFVVKERTNGGSNYITLSSKIEVQETDKEILDRLQKEVKMLHGFINDYEFQVKIWKYEIDLLNKKINESNFS